MEEETEAINTEDVEMAEETKEEEKGLTATEHIEAETTSTSPTTIPALEDEQSPPQKYYLFEKVMEFLDESNAPLNPVLSGYFSKLMLMLISNKTR